MISPRTYFARMNENRGDNDWLTQDKLLKGTEQFFRSNGYVNVQYDRILDQGGRTFSSPIVASRTAKYDAEEMDETIVSIFKSRIEKYDLTFLGHLESFTFDVLDNYELTNPILVTDSLSYFYIIKNQEISVAVENLMREGLLILFLNHQFAYAFFDKFENMTKPIPVYD
jgi:hypothetical protein